MGGGVVLVLGVAGVVGQTVERHDDEVTWSVMTRGSSISGKQER